MTRARINLFAWFIVVLPIVLIAAAVVASVWYGVVTR